MALAAKLIYRAEKYGYSLPVSHPITLPEETDEGKFGEILFGVLDQAQRLGIDAEVALRSATKEYIDRIRAHEAGENQPSD